MKFVYFLILLIFFGVNHVFGQLNEVELLVYDSDDGLSHRNVFKIAQDQQGYLWVATLNGLSRFDGYEFINYSTFNPAHQIPYNAISDLLIDDRGDLWLANPDFITHLDMAASTANALKIKEGDIIRRESWVPHSLYMDHIGKIWMATYNEKSAETYIQSLDLDLDIDLHLKVPGNYTKRPIVQIGNHYFIAAYGDELWQIDEQGQLIGKVHLMDGEEGARIVQLQADHQQIWVMLMDGSVYNYQPSDRRITPHPINDQLPEQGAVMNTFWVDQNQDVWVGGRGRLWYYRSANGQLVDYHPKVFEMIKNTCTYRQVFQDAMGTIWVATDFGLIKLTQPKGLFYRYLDGGNEYCSNVYCSIRGITEDDEGNLYFSYYNSIHVLDPLTNNLRLLFPEKNFFNLPFGITYFDPYLYTGNGLKINPKTLEIDTLLAQRDIDLGVAMVNAKQEVWFGYEYELYRYLPNLDSTFLFEDQYGSWDTTNGVITHLLQSKVGDYLWVSTFNNGVYKIEEDQGRTFHMNSRSPVNKLRSDQVNVTYEEDSGVLWLGTAQGLHQFLPNENRVVIFTMKDGLPNDFINGLLPEGDSVLWISTDLGLSRFSKKDKSFKNFNTQDGLSANEFNRISFFKASDGRLYFGGLDGVNAFYPNERLLSNGQSTNNGHLMFTKFSRFNSELDSLVVLDASLKPGDTVLLDHNDKYFNIHFSWSDFNNTSTNQYSYWLEGYEGGWSPPSTTNIVRFNEIPAGHYVFQLKARSPGGHWHQEPIALHIIVQQAFYKTWWFIGLCLILLFGLLWGIMRYRIYRIRRHELELEEQVVERTRELTTEKQKSEELLLNILPVEIAEELKANGVAKAKRHELVTVMFSDFKSFTKISEKMDPEKLVAEIDWCFRAFDKITEKHHLEKIKTIGDAYLCVGGIVSGSQQDAVNVIRAALEIQAFLKDTATLRKANNLPFFEARIGIHTGPIVAGIVGIKKFAYDIWGDTVNIASRIETNGQVGEVNVSGTTYDLVKDHFRFEYHGQYHESDRAPIDMYFVQ